MNNPNHSPEIGPKPVVPVNVLRVMDQLDYPFGGGLARLLVVKVHQISRIMGSLCPRVEVDYQDHDGNWTKGPAGLLVGTRTDADRDFIVQAVPQSGSQLTGVILEVTDDKGAAKLLALDTDSS